MLAKPVVWVGPKIVLNGLYTLGPNLNYLFINEQITLISDQSKSFVVWYSLTHSVVASPDTPNTYECTCRVQYEIASLLL